MAELDRMELIGRLRALGPELRARGVTGMALFGSRARGDNRPDSDVDVFIDVPRETAFSLLDLIAVQHVVGDAIGLPTQVTLRRDLSPGLARAAREDAIEVGL